MALIKCPECGKPISDKSMACAYCGLPSTYYVSATALNQPAIARKDELQDFNPKEFKNALIAFDRDYVRLFSPTALY